MWGQVYQKYDGNQPVRIIPTRVGTSAGEMAVEAIEGDHPHACGDKQCDTCTLCVEKGSSPRVWGQGAVGVGHELSAGIIPTRVGTSIRGHFLTVQGWDHPHACGDKVFA